MNKTKIDWVRGPNGEPGYTWNPITGCLHNCPYCYAKRIADRFAGKRTEDRGECLMNTGYPELTEQLERKINGKQMKVAFPFGFYPTFHRYRLNEPAKLKKPAKIFVCSMADLFGEWVPDEWAEKVYMACQKADQHQYLFLTKNPKGYRKIYRSELDYRYYMWFGTSITNEDDMCNKGNDLFCNTGLESKRHAKRFISIEPLLGEISNESLKNIQYLDWVIIGQQTGPGAVPPKAEWVQIIIDQCRAAGIPVFVKSPLYKQFPIQEWPEGLEVEK